MVLIAFYYLLRVGEYTYHAPSDQRLTKQVTVADVTFWHHTTILPPTTPTVTLFHTCTAATLVFRNQKNGHKNGTVHARALSTDYCPVPDSTSFLPKPQWPSSTSTTRTPRP